MLLFVVLSAAFARGLIGGGDVKIMTALAVGLSPVDATASSLPPRSQAAFWRSLISCSLPAPHQHDAAHVITWPRLPVEAWRIRRHGPLPYGVAIAAGGAFVLFHPGSL